MTNGIGGGGLCVFCRSATHKPRCYFYTRRPEDWEIIAHVFIRDRVGWEADNKPWSEPVTRQEFNERASRSTIVLTEAADVQRREAIADAILGSEAFMWLMAGANHPETHLNILRPAFEAWKSAGGISYGRYVPPRETSAADMTAEDINDSLDFWAGRQIADDEKSLWLTAYTETTGPRRAAILAAMPLSLGLCAAKINTGGPEALRRAAGSNS